MTSARTPFDYEDEIDVRQILTTLLQKFWLILIVTLLFAIAGFLVTKFVLQKEYQATAYVMIVKPSTVTNLDPRIQSSLQLPDTKSLTDLTRADDLLAEIIHSPEVAGLIEEDIQLSAFRNKLQPTLVGTNQLRLQVTHTDPVGAAAIANTWAQIVTERLNSLFGTDATSLSKVEAQAEEARTAWDMAEQALIDYLPQSDLDAVQINLSQAKKSLERTLNAIDELDMLLSNTQVLKTRLEAQGGNDPLAFEDSLSLVTLQQQATGSLQGIQLQITSPEIMSAEYTVAEARTNLNTLISALETQRIEYQARAQGQEAGVTALATALENAQYQVDQLTVERDLSLQSYEALSNQVAEVQITLSQDEKVAQVAGQALPPDDHSAPSTLLNTAITAAAGGFLTVTYVLVMSWWKSSPQLPPPVKSTRTRKDILKD